MPDEYQFGSDKEWLEHSNEELARMLKKQQRRSGRQRTVIFILFVLLAAVLYRFHQKLGIQELWRF